MKHAVTLAFVLLACHAHAQKPVYRCETKGKVEYSHAPCVGAVEIDVTPTRGADRWTGQSRKSTELRREELNEQIGRAVRPLTGMDDPTWKTATSRQKLKPAERQECYRLDPLLSQQAAAAKDATGDAKAQADVQLYKLRKRFSDLNC